MALSPAHEIIGVRVFEQAQGGPITLDLRRVMSQFAQHRESYGCGCEWLSKANEIKVWRSAGYWQRCGRRV